jgi:hypothetical protein
MHHPAQDVLENNALRKEKKDKDKDGKKDS